MVLRKQLLGGKGWWIRAMHLIYCWIKPYIFRAYVLWNMNLLQDLRGVRRWNVQELPISGLAPQPFDHTTHNRAERPSNWFWAGLNYIFLNNRPENYPPGSFEWCTHLWHAGLNAWIIWFVHAFKHAFNIDFPADTYSQKTPGTCQVSNRYQSWIL